MSRQALPTVKDLPAVHLRHKRRLTPEQRLAKIAEIIEAVDRRAAATDGPVTPTLQEMTQAEISEIYRLASGKP